MIVNVITHSQDDPSRYSFLEEEVTLGRNPGSTACLTIDEPSVSRKHLLLRVVKKQIQVMDMGSSNGTKLNGVTLEQHTWTDLQKEDKIKIAEHVGYITVTLREQSVSDYKKKKEESPEKRDRSRDKSSIQISDSTIKMLKEMTHQRKSKQEMVKFLKLMGYAKAGECWQDIEALIVKNRKMSKIDTAKVGKQLEKQFEAGRANIGKRGLGN